jgi:DNA modification methylase
MRTARILVGDVRERLRDLPDGSVQCCVTSPPYWGLRDYGVDGQLGLERTPHDYVTAMVGVFREVWRVLRDDGTCWINLGDSYNAYNGGAGPSSSLSRGAQTTERPQLDSGYGLKFKGLKPKDLVGIPWRVAFALQADGWYLRSDIIWSKPNPMPESVTDRPTKAHEMIFLLTKSERYFYDAAAIAERVSEPSVVAGPDGDGQRAAFLDNFGFQSARSPFAAVCIRLAATVLYIAQRQNDLGLFALDSEIGQQGADSGARLPVVHIPVVRRAASQASRFADGDVSAKEFLEEMDGLCVALPDGNDLKEAWRLASLYVRHIDADGDATVTVNDASKVGQVERIHRHNHTARVPSSNWQKRKALGEGPRRGFSQNAPSGCHRVGDGATTRNKRSVWHVATQPYPEAHFATYPEALIEPCILAGSRVDDTVLDPFCGSGTTGVVACRHNRHFVGIELNPTYAQLAEKRIVGDAALLNRVEVA